MDEPMAFDWTEERIERLGFMWKRGWSANAIAAELGVSRNAVIGKVHRLPWIRALRPRKEHPERMRHAAPRKSVRERVEAAKPAPPPPSLPPERPPAPATPLTPPEPQPGAPATRPLPRSPRKPPMSLEGFALTDLPSLKWKPRKDGLVGLVDLKVNSCRWPYGDPKETTFGYCGKDNDVTSPYCAAHRARAYQRRTGEEAA